MSKYQTISEFLARPFKKASDANKDATYNSRYMVAKEKGGLKLTAFTTIKDSYYLHVVVPSQSRDGNYSYDVILRFFPETPEVSNEPHLLNYKVQFFSNSPSFMYHYAYLYNKNGYLIEALYNKLDADYINVAPEKSNPNMVMSYDISIYITCRFLTDYKARLLFKDGPMKRVEKDSTAFFRDVSDFRSIKFDQSLMSEEKKLSNILDSKSPKRIKERRERALVGNHKKPKITAKTSTSGPITSATMKRESNRIKPKQKTTAKRSTRP